MPQFDPSDFEVLYPGVLTEKEKDLVEKYMADNRALQERGPINVQALVEGRLPQNTPGLGPTLAVAEDMVRYNNYKYDPENPLLHDAEYAKKLGYKDILAMPCFGAHDDTFMAPWPADARDTLLVSQLCHSVTNHKPVYPGDTLYLVTHSRHVTDLTPVEGSIYRSVALRTHGSVYNQRGEKVNDVVFGVTESLKVFKVGKRPGKLRFQDLWEAPDWQRRRPHFYSDKDWDFIKSVWSKEKRRAAEPLYWEDVKTGDEPAWTVDGPIIETLLPTAPFGMGTGGSRTMKKEIMDPAIVASLVRSKEDGIFRPADPKVYVPPVPDNPGIPFEIEELRPADAAVDTRDIHKADGIRRAPLINFLGRDIAIRHINNWMGDHGWLLNIRWGIMPAPTMVAYGKPVPEDPEAERFLDNVPYMKDRTADAHGLTRDLALVKSYVCDSYVRDGEFLVELVWWIETIDGDIWLAGGATVKLPSKRAN